MKNILRNEKLIVFLLFSVLIGAVYSQVFFFGKSLLPSLYYREPVSAVSYGRMPINSFNIDLATPAFYESPVNKLVGDMYKKGILPLWNPYQGCGTPLAAQYSTRAFFPYQIIEDISPTALWDYFMLARLIIAAFFTYLLLRLLGVSPPCAFLGGIFYCLSGSFTWFINLEQFTNVAMMVPVFLFSLERFIQYKKGRYFAECAFVLALVFLAGQPEIVIYVALLAALYFLFRSIIEKPGFISFMKSILTFAGIIFLGLSLSAFLIMPFLELIPISYQCHPLGGTMGRQDPTPIQIAVSILVPSFFELPTYYRFFPHNGLWDWLGGYTGILMFFVVIAGCLYPISGPSLKKQSKKKLTQKGKVSSMDKRYIYFLFFALFGFSVILKNFGFPLVAWIGDLPLLNQSWSPRWAGPVWTFSLACAAAIGLEITSEIPRKKNVVLGILLLLFLAVVFFSLKTTYFQQFKSMNSSQLKSVLPPVLGGIAVSLSVISIASIIFLYCGNKKGFIFSIIFLALSELWFYIPKGAGFPWTVFKFIPFLLAIPVIYLLANEKWRLSVIGIILIVFSYAYIDVKSPNGFPDRRDIFRETGYTSFLKKNIGYSRIAAGDGILMPNFSSSYGIYDVRYINSLSPATYQNYVDRHLLKEPHAWITDRLWFTGVPDGNKPGLSSLYQDMSMKYLYYSYLGIKYIITPRKVSINLPSIYEGDVNIYLNQRSFERVYIAYNIKIAPGFEEAQELIKDGNADIKDTVILEEEPPPWYKPVFTEPAGSQAEIKDYTPNRIKIKADMKSDGVLVLTDVFYPGWKAYVDNKAQRIYRVNGLVRGVFLRQGVQEIVFKYEPLSFRMGVLISAISVFICIVLIGKDNARGHKIEQSVRSPRHQVTTSPEKK